MSKSFLLGATQKESLYIKNKDFYNKNGVRILLGTKVVSIDRKNKYVILDNEQKKIYTKLIIASGSNLKEIQFPGDNNSISYLRTIDDSEKLKNDIESKNSIAIIGSGYIGLEIAATASKNNLDINVIEFENRVMSRSASSQISSFFESKHKKAGVNFRFGLAATHIKNGDKNKNLFLSDGTTVKAEIVAAVIGVEPNIFLAKESGLKCKNGIIVDQNCLTSDKNIFAIGDVSGPPLLAHVASAEGKFVADLISKSIPRDSTFEYGNIPSCVYSKPEIASVGMTEVEARDRYKDLRIGTFPFSALGKAVAINNTSGFVKVIFDNEYGELLGCHIIGHSATEIVLSACLARTLETTAKEILHTTHPHPTMSESFQEAVADAYNEALHL